MKSMLKTNVYNIKQFIKNVFSKRSTRQLFALTVLTCFLLVGTFAWFYNEFISTGTNIHIGTIEQKVTMYDTEGVKVNENNDTVIFENSMQAGYYNSRYFSVENVGSLDMQYNITFDLDATIANAGIMYYNLYEITDQVLNTDIGSFDTKLEAYVNSNKLTSNPEIDQSGLIKNMSTLSSEILNDKIIINDAANNTSNPKYYRIDYGMYQLANTSKYSDTLVAVHTNVYATQLSADINSQSTGQTWIVENEEQLRNAMIYAINGDTILLNYDIEVEGSLAFNRLVNLDLNSHKLSVTGDLTWDVVYEGNLLIDASARGTLDVGNDLYINTPKSQVEILGANTSYDIYVGRYFTVNGLQTGEVDGILLNNCRIVKNISTLVPVDIEVMSDTRLTLGPDVQVGYIHAVEDSTNIEIINNGTITQINFADMKLLDTYSKYQIYVYNLNVIYGAVGSSSIILPPEATPYRAPNDGNTKIIQGVLASDITIEGSTHFNSGNIEYSEAIEAVVPIDGEENSYYVYIRESTDIVEELLVQYFIAEGASTPYTEIAKIKKLIFYTVNAQYFENEDFEFLKNDSKIPNLEYLGLANTRIYNSETSSTNSIVDYAMSGKSSLRTVILPNTITTIGAHAFDSASIGYLPADKDEQFTFLTIPSSVTSIGEYAFANAKYVKFIGLNPPEIGENAFDITTSGAKLFVPLVSLPAYLSVENLNEANIHQAAYLSDNRSYFIYDNDGVGISLYVGTTAIGSSLTIPTNITAEGTSYPVTSIGPNAYRNLNITNAMSLVFPDTVTEIGYSAFKNLKINRANLNKVINISEYAFYETELEDISASSLKTIGDYAFYNISTLNTASFSQLNSIGKYGIANCINLYEINLGLVNYLGDYALYNNRGLLRVYFNNINTQPYNNTYTVDMSIGEQSIFSNWGYYSDGRLRIYVPDGEDSYGNKYIDLYKQLDIFKDNVNYIYPQGFITGSYEHLSIPYDIGEFNYRIVNIDGNVGAELVEYHGQDLYTGFDIPTTIELQGELYDVISIGEGAFRNSKTKSDTIIDITGTNLLTIEKYGFYNSGITSISANNVTYIGDYAFGNTSLVSGSFKKLNYLGKYAFYNMPSLSYLNLGSVKTILDSAVSNNPNLEQIFILNDDISTMTIVGTPFKDIGTNAENWLRIYVPGEALTDYKTLLSDYANFIYESGDYMYGSYINGTINYDIGEYMLKYVTLDDYNGVSKQGVKIIDYHGGTIDSNYKFPTTFTISDQVYEVVSIGQRAYKYAKTTDNSKFDIKSSSLIEIGEYAFNGSNIIGNINAKGVTTIGTHAFDESSLNTGVFENLNTLGSFAFANSEELYMLDLGKVQILPAYSLYNLPKLSQLFFGINTNSLTFSSFALWNIGGNTNDRMRIYVSNTSAGGGQTYLDVYRNSLCDSNNDYNYESYFYARGKIIGSYTQTNIPYDIGEYSVAEITVNDYNNNSVEGLEFVEYHGDDINSSYQFPTIIDTNNDLSASISISNSWNSTVVYSVKITNKTDNDIDNWRLILSQTENSYITSAENLGYVNNTTVAEVYPVNDWNKTISANSTKEYKIYYNSSNTSYIPNVNRIYDVNNDQTERIISVGDYAYKHAKMESNVSFDVDSEYLLNIGSYAFYRMGINKIIAPNVSTIGAHAFEESKLIKGEFDHLKTIYTYAFSKITTLYKLDLGQVSSMEKHALYMLPQLSQVFFDGVDNVSFSQDAINSVGTATGSEEPYYRIRFYVTDDENSSGITFVNMYKDLFPAYADYFYPEGIIVGSYIQSNIPYDIGEQSVRVVTYTNSLGQAVTGYELVEYHGEDLNNNYSIPNRISASDYMLDVDVSEGVDAGNNTTSYTLTIKNNNNVDVNSWALDISQSDNEKVSYVQNGSYSDKGLYAELLSLVNESIPANSSITIDVWYSSNNTSYIPKVTNAREQDSQTNTYDVISIGDYAYKHSKKENSTDKIEIYNDTLLNIGNYVFNNLEIVSKLYLSEAISIGDYAFNKNVLEELELNKVNSIGKYAFADNEKLMYVNLGKVQNIGEKSFYNDYAIEQIIFTSESVSSSELATLTIGTDAFMNSATLIGDRLRVYVPDGDVSSNLTIAQAYKDVLKNVNISSSVSLGEYTYPQGVIIGSYTYNGLSYDIGQYSVRQVTKPNISGGNTKGLEIIEYHGTDIDNDNNLFVIPDEINDTGYNVSKVISIGNNAFAKSVINSWDLVLGVNIINVGNYAFNEKNITTINANDIVTMGSYAFNNCDMLTSISFSSLVNVGSYAFNDCNELTDLYLGSDGKIYGDYAFYYPYNEGDPVREFIILSSTPPTASTHTFPGYDSNQVRIRTSLFGYTTYTYYNYNVHFQVPTSSEETYETTNPYKIYATDSVTSYWITETYGTGDMIDGVDVSYGYSYLIIDSSTARLISYRGISDTAVLPSTATINGNTYTITEIAATAFDSASLTTSITIPSTVTYIEPGFLANNTLIDTINVNSNNNYFSSIDGVLYSKDQMTLVRYPSAKAVSTINNYGETVYSQYTVNNGTKTISSYAFTNVQNLDTITFPSSVNVISSMVFTNCANLTNYIFNGSTPPVLTGFDAFPIIDNLSIKVPTENVNTYKTTIYYNQYTNYIRGN